MGFSAFLILLISVSAPEGEEGESFVCVAGISFMCYLRKGKIHLKLVQTAFWAGAVWS